MCSVFTSYFISNKCTWHCNVRGIAIVVQPSVWNVLAKLYASIRSFPLGELSQEWQANCVKKACFHIDKNRCCGIVIWNSLHFPIAFAWNRKRRMHFQCLLFLDEYLFKHFSFRTSVNCLVQRNVILWTYMKIFIVFILYRTMQEKSAFYNG